MKLIDGSKVFPSAIPPYGMQQVGGIQNKPELHYEQFIYRDLTVPLTTAVRIQNGEFIADASETDPGSAVAADTISGLQLSSEVPKLNGVYLENTKGYTVKDSKICMSGVGEDDFAGIGSGVLLNKESDVVLENLDIHMAGAGRSCTTAIGGSKLTVRNCNFVVDGGPLPEDYVPKIGRGMLEPPSGLEIGGTSRCHLSLDQSKTYFYDSTITAAGWAGLSTDYANEYVYLEANNCDVVVKDVGYGVYSDVDCHVVLNNCRLSTATHTAILAGECDLALNNCTALAGKYCAMVHDVKGIDTEIGQLFIRGGYNEAGEELLLLRSCNTYIEMIGADVVSKSGVLVRAIVNPDEHATKVGEKDVFGNNIVMAYMKVEGDLLNEDPDRCMKITLDNTMLAGAIEKAYVTMNAGSKWTATKDSTVVLVGDCRIGQIDAAEGVTINAEAGEGCPLSGKYKLASGGVLVVA